MISPSLWGEAFSVYIRRGESENELSTLICKSYSENRAAFVAISELRGRPDFCNPIKRMAEATRFQPIRGCGKTGDKSECKIGSEK